MSMKVTNLGSDLDLGSEEQGGTGQARPLKWDKLRGGLAAQELPDDPDPAAKM
jgi:hypothetical protein